MGEEWVTVGEIASRLGISKMTVYRLIHGGRIGAVRVGKSYRVRQQDYQAYLEKARMDDGGSRS